MKPETRRAFNAAMSAHWTAAPSGMIDRTECEAAFLGGMLEAARLCRERARQHRQESASQASPREAESCAELIESSVKGE